MALNFNVDPYFDDFDSTKNFHRILFKPGFAVQARELTQSQTILQDQISKFGLGIYKDGSKVSGGNIFVDDKYLTLKIESNENIENFTSLFAVGQTSKLVAEVVSVDINNYFVITKPLNVNNDRNFSSAETIKFYTSKLLAFGSLNSTIPETYSATAITESSITRTSSGSYLSDTLVINTSGVNVGDTITISSINYVSVVVNIIDNNSVTLFAPLPEEITNASTVIGSKTSVQCTGVSIDNGVWFTNGLFVANYNDIVIPNALTKFPSVVVGFEVEETTIDSYDDSSLLDPAIGASNYQAPGADRYKVTLNLVNKPYVSQQIVENLTTNKFIELVRINKGTIENITNDPTFSEISKTMARQLSEQSGDFIVSPFNLTLSNNTTEHTTFASSISSGKAYINGYRVEKLAPTTLYLDKARDIATTSDSLINTYYGNYSTVRDLNGTLVNFQTGTKVELHNVFFHSADSNTKIGTAGVRNFSYDSGELSNTEYRMYLFDVNMTGSDFSNVKSFIIPGASNNYTNVTFSANAVSSSAVVDSNYNSLLFPFDQKNVSNVSNVNYITTRYYTAATFVNGNYTITTNGSNEKFVGGDEQENYIVMTTSASGSYPAGKFIPMDQANVSITINNAAATPQATINIAGGFNGSAVIYATISVTNDTRKTKVLNSNYALEVSANTLNTTIDLGKSDVYKFKGIFELGNTIPYSGNWDSATSYSANTAVFYGSNVYISLASSTAVEPNTNTSLWSAVSDSSSNYVLDNGQRDEYYDHGTIKNVSGSPKGDVVAVFDYFTHSGGSGYIDVDSYPVSYGDIPSYTSKQYGTTYNLRDVLDFRPRRVDGIGATTFSSFQLTAPSNFNSAFADYGYYLGRKDKIVLYPNGQFRNIKGISSYLNPKEPSDIDGALTLFTLTYPAYTFSKNDVVIKPSILKRYTMKDIGVLDKRITDVEYYTALSLLESQVTGQDVTDSTGENILYKNGFLVDSFKGHSVGDVNNPDYQVSIDFNDQIARPLYSSNIASYNVDTNQGVFRTGKLNNYLSIKDNIVTFSYDETTLVNQNVATQIINVNPFNVVNFVGDLKLSPTSDVWYDTQTQPIINEVSEDQSAWIAAVNGSGNGTQWNQWQITWSGQNVVTSGNQTQISRDTQAIQQAIASKGLIGAIKGGNIVVSTSTKILSNSIIPYAREVEIDFELNGMAPYTKLHTFINGTWMNDVTTPKAGSTDGVWNIKIDNPGTGYTNGNNQSIITIVGSNTIPAIVTANVVGGQIVAVNISQVGAGYNSTPTIRVNGTNTTTALLSTNTEYGVAGTQVMTNGNGYASGKIKIPNSNVVKIPTGTITIEFCDLPYIPVIRHTYAKASFTSSGTIQNIQETVTSTRPPIISPKTVTPVYTPPTGGGGVYYPPSPASSSYIDDPAVRGSSYSKSQGLAEAAATIAATLSKQGVSSDNIAYLTNPSNMQAYYNSSSTVLGAITGTSTLPSITSMVSTALGTWDLVKSGQSSGVDAALSRVTSSNVTLAQNGAFGSTAASGTSATVGYASSKGSTPACLNGSDPLSQNFWVNELIYPNGIFVSSVDLFFATKDTLVPVNVRIRPVVNGYPDAVNDIPGSIVWKNPSDISVPSSNNTTNSIGQATTFTFDHPIYLPAGQYSLMVATNSINYTVYASKLGQIQYGTQKVVSALNYTASLFKSQNASTWVAAPGETLCFNLKMCDFAVGSSSFDATSKASGATHYDVTKLITQEITFTGLDTITYQVTTKDNDTSATSVSSISPNENYNFSTRQIQNSAGDITITPTLINADRWTSPVVDLERLNTILIKNEITPYYSANTVSESLGGYYNGGAASRYITRRVTLNENFDSTGITVYVDVNRQSGSKIEVYYKVMNAVDQNDFDDQPYVLMDAKTSTISGSGLPNTGVNDWTEDTYQALNITYNDIATGVTYNNFKVFAIKICMYSDNPAIVPQLKKLRVIASA